MKRRVTLGFILAIVSLLPLQYLYAQSVAGSLPADSVQAQKEAEVIKKGAAAEKKHKPLLSGISVSGDLVGLACRMFSSYGQYEGAIRLNLRERFFPICELGIGSCDNTDDATELHYQTTAPYIRVGCDYNILKDKDSGNRVFAGVRVAYTSFNFDVDGPDQTDPVWGNATPYSFHNQKASCTWAEIVGGLEAKIWGIFHLGWTLRCRFRASQSSPYLGEAWYIPGFGKNGSTRLGATFNVIFDI